MHTEANVSEQTKTDGLALDVEALTIGDLEDFQDVTGKSLGDVLGEGHGGDMKVLKAIVWIAKRQQDPTTTLDDVRSIRFADLSLSGDTEDVQEAEAEAAADPS